MKLFFVDPDTKRAYGPFESVAVAEEYMGEIGIVEAVECFETSPSVFTIPSDEFFAMARATVSEKPKVREMSPEQDNIDAFRAMRLVERLYIIGLTAQMLETGECSQEYQEEFDSMALVPAEPSQRPDRVYGRDGLWMNR